MRCSREPHPSWGIEEEPELQAAMLRIAGTLSWGLGRDGALSWDTRESNILGLTKAFTLVGGTVHKDFGRDDIAKRQKHLRELRVPELLGQVINKQVTALGTWVTHKGQHTSAARWGHPGGTPGSHWPHEG